MESQLNIQNAIIMDDLTDKFFLPNFDKTQKGKLLGTGSFGKVYRYQNDKCVKVIRADFQEVETI